MAHPRIVFDKLKQTYIVTYEPLPRQKVLHSTKIYAEAFGAFANENYAETVALLEPALSNSVMLGGSNPQRRIVEETYLQACLNAKQYAKARGLIAARKRPDSNFDKMLLDDIRVLEEGCSDDNE